MTQLTNQDEFLKARFQANESGFCLLLDGNYFGLHDNIDHIVRALNAYEEKETMVITKESITCPNCGGLTTIKPHYCINQGGKT